MANKKKKRSGGYKLNYRERKVRGVNPMFKLFLYFVVCAALAYPLVWVFLTYVFKTNPTSLDLGRLSIGLGFAGAAYYGVILKAQREGRS